MTQIEAPTRSPAPEQRSGGVAVIVCAYTLDRIDDVTDCIDALHRQTQLPDEIVAVIDHNPALEAEVSLRALAREWSRLTVVANTATRGLSGARNTGVATTAGAITVFIDDDAVPHDDWLAELIAPFANADVAATGGHIEPGWPGVRPGWFPDHLDWTIGCSIPTLPADGGPIRNMYGASAAFRRSALDAVGGFPTELGRVGADAAGCEETEVCIRIRQIMPTATVVYAPRSHVVHRVSDDRTRVAYVLRRCLAEGRSKAKLSRRVGAGVATSDERGYAATIAGAVARDVFGSVRDPQRLARAAVLVAGFAAAAFGYVGERVRSR